MNKQDLEQIKERNVTEEQVERQVAQLKRGTTFVKLIRPATIGDGILTQSDVSDEAYVGIAGITITAQGDGGTYTTNIVAAYTIVEPELPPSEETEESPWDFTSITVADGTATLTWAMPADNVPEAGSCDFRIEWRTSLTAGAWSDDSASFVVEGVTSADGCKKTIPLPDIGTPANAFFRLFWTNKVKE